MFSNVLIYIIIGLIILALCSRRAIKRIIAITAICVLVALVVVPTMTTSEDVIQISDKVAIYNDTDIQNDANNEDYFVIAQINWTSIYQFVQDKWEEVDVVEWLLNCEIVQKVRSLNIASCN